MPDELKISNRPPCIVVPGDYIPWQEVVLFPGKNAFDKEKFTVKK
jgi:hypothetical protein